LQSQGACNGARPRVSQGRAFCSPCSFRGGQSPMIFKFLSCDRIITATYRHMHRHLHLREPWPEVAVPFLIVSTSPVGWISLSVCHARGKASRHRMSPGLCSFGPMLPIAENVGCFDIEIYGTIFRVDAIARWSSNPVASLLCLPPFLRTRVTSVLLLTQTQSSRQESADGGASYAE
jgi:hypothetical protein